MKAVKYYHLALDQNKDWLAEHLVRIWEVKWIELSVDCYPGKSSVFALVLVQAAINDVCDTGVWPAILRRKLLSTP